MSIRLADRGQERELMAWIIRKFPEGRIPSEQAQYLVHHPEELPDLLLGMIARRNITSAEQLQAVVSDWQKFFGYLRIWDSSFNESNFPLGADPGDEAEELGFDRLVTGHEAIREFEQIKRRPASLWAQGRYIKAKPRAQKDHLLVGIGARWRDRIGDVWFPVFRWDGDGPGVSLGSLDGGFDPDCRFLLSKEERG